MEKLAAALPADGVRLTRVEPHVPTLEDLYFTIRREAGIVAGIGGVSGDDAGAEHSGGPILPRERGLAPVTTGHGQLPPLGNGTAASGRPSSTDEPMTGAPR